MNITMNIASHDVLGYRSGMDEIDRKIQAGRSRLDQIKAQMEALERERIVTEARVEAYQDARDHYAALRNDDHHEGVGEPAPRIPDASRTARALTGVWLETMRGVGHLPQFGVEDILNAAQLKGHAPSAANIRSQIHNYKTRGIVEAVGHGTYRFTASGRDALGLGEDEGAASDREQHAGNEESDLSVRTAAEV